MRRVAVRVQEDVREPHPPQAGSNLGLRIDRHRLVGVRRGVDPEGSPVAGVQDVLPVDLVHVPGELGAVGVLDRVEDDVDLVEVFLAFGIGEQHFGEPQRVRRRGNLVRVLAGAVEDGRLQQARLPLRPVRGLHGRHQVHRPGGLSQVAFADLVNRGFGELGHPRQDPVGLGRRDRRVPLHELVVAAGRVPERHDVREGRRLPVRRQGRHPLRVRLVAPVPGRGDLQIAEPRERQLVRIEAGSAQFGKQIQCPGDLCRGHDPLVGVVLAVAFHVVVPLILVRVHLHPEPEAVQPGVSGAHPRRHRLRPAHLHLGDVPPHGAGAVRRPSCSPPRSPAGWS